MLGCSASMEDWSSASDLAEAVDTGGVLLVKDRTEAPDAGIIVVADPVGFVDVVDVFPALRSIAN